jgi:hypothetical protein
LKLRESLKALLFLYLVFMDVLIERLKEFEAKLNTDEALAFGIDSDMEELIIDLNQDQLYEAGQDSEGKSLGKYSPYTIGIKQRKGQPTNRITLYDTGEFYESFTVKYTGGELVLDANGEKDDTNLFEEYGVDILGLNDRNMSIFIKELAKRIIFYLSNK